MSSGVDILDAVRRGDHHSLQQAVLQEKSNVRFLVHKDELLIMAAGFGHMDIIRLLLSSGLASIDQRARQSNRTALHAACSAGASEIVVFLLNYAKDHEQFEEVVDARDREGLTAVHVAAAQGEMECLNELNKAGVNLVMTDKNGRQPIHLAAQRNHAKIVRKLYDLGVEIEVGCDAGKTPAHYAAFHGSLNALRCLVERNCDLSLEDCRGNQPIHMAAGRDQLECLRFIVDQGIAPGSPKSDGRQTTHLAAQYNASKSLHWLLDVARVNPNAKDSQENTPSHYATEKGNAECYSCLLRHGADPEVINGMNENCSQTARRYGHPVLMEKAATGEVVCKYCHQSSERSAWEHRHKVAPVITALDQSSKTAYTSPLGSYTNERNPKVKRKRPQNSRGDSRKNTGSGRNDSDTFLTGLNLTTDCASARERDLIAKYYGDYADAV